MKLIITGMIVFLVTACSGSSTDTNSGQDTLPPHVPVNDSGLQPVDSSRYHTDTSTQHTMF